MIGELRAEETGSRRSLRARRPVGAAERRALLRRGLALEYVTLGWNVAGVVVLAVAAVQSASVALAGFGVDSLIEILASVVVVWQLRGEQASARERRALRVISIAFGLLVLYLAAQTAVTLATSAHPRPSPLGIVWLAITALAMLALAAGKRDTGRRLGNRVLLTESRVTVVDGALAGAVLVGVGLDAAAGWWWADPLAALVVLAYGAGEARHAWQESRAAGGPV